MVVIFVKLVFYSSFGGLDSGTGSSPAQALRRNDVGRSKLVRCEGEAPGAGFQERRKQDVCAAAPMDGFTAVLKTRSR